MSKRENILVKKLASSAISEAKYERDTYTLTITFTNGNTYEYPDCEEALYKGLIRATSAGKYFNKHIRPRFAA